METPFFEVTHYINGEFVNSPLQFEKLYPATNQVIGTVAEGKQAEVDRAVSAAKNAFKTWGKMSASQRRPILRAFAEGIRKNADELARIETFDVGRAIRENNIHYIERIANNIEYFADFAALHGSESYPMDSGYINYVLRQPVGVAVLITPWNIPMLLSTWKIGPALAFGNTAILKPAESTPIGAWKLAQIAHEAGVPAGVFNVVQGFGPNSAGAYLTSHPDVRLISFTGETSTGQAILKAAAGTNMARVSFELGGKGPNIIFDDADIERALAISQKAAFVNQGEVCLAGSRILVQRGIYNEFVERFAAKLTNETVIGDPLDPATEMGTAANEPQFNRIMAAIDSAKGDGATLVTGGARATGAGLDDGLFIQPTIFSGVTNDMKVAQNEIFGPVLSVISFEEEDEAIAIANDIPYGLASGVWTTNLSRAMRTIPKLRSGVVWVNTYRMVAAQAPFGGVKESGFGRERGEQGLLEFTNVKNVMIDFSGEKRDPFAVKN